MAYLRELGAVHCALGCGRRAVVELFDRWNGSRGKFCRRCGEREKRRVEALTESGT